MGLDFGKGGLTALRWVLGSTFTFSGVVKCVDPVGTAIFVEKYLATYSLEALLPLSLTIAIALSVMEFSLGCLIIDRVFSRVVSTITLSLVALFTVVTLLSATILPIGECGCFGNVIELTPWQTFFKNVVLLIMAFVVWRSERGEAMTFNFVAVIFSIAVPLIINIYALRHLPIIDFMPYDEGRNLREEVLKERAEERDAVRSMLKFRSVTTNDEQLFDSTDSACWLNDDLEFVEAVTITSEVADLTYNDFHLYTSEGEDVTENLLQRSGHVVLLCINDGDVSKKQMRGIEQVMAKYSDDDIVVLSAMKVDEEWCRDIEQLSIDAMTLRSMMRADVGVVVLCDGVVEFKANIRDL
ncbi:MAG: hypothetical protein IKY74_03380 [Alistipes sp.]|nr:hypothetical protein [Alistipes sp.]